MFNKNVCLFSVVCFGSVVSILTDSAMSQNVFMDQWSNRHSDTKTEFLFKPDGTFYVYEESVVKAGDITVIGYQYGKGKWNWEQDEINISAKMSGVQKVSGSHGSPISHPVSKNVKFKKEGDKVFIMTGKAQRELSGSNKSNRDIEKFVSAAVRDR